MSLLAKLLCSRAPCAWQTCRMARGSNGNVRGNMPQGQASPHILLHVMSAQHGSWLVVASP